MRVVSCADDMRCEAIASPEAYTGTCNLVVEAKLSLTLMVTSSNHSAQTAEAFSRQTQAAGVLQELQDCEDTDDPAGCRSVTIGRLMAVLVDVTTGSSSCLTTCSRSGSDDEACTTCAQEKEFATLINAYPKYQPATSEFGRDQVTYCSALAQSLPAYIDETTCCAILDLENPWKRHCGPRSTKYMISRMDWNNGYDSMWIAAEDSSPGYRFFPDECTYHRLKLKPKWHAVDLDGDDWRLSALMRLLAGVEGDYHDMSNNSMLFSQAYGKLIQSGGEGASDLDSLPTTWRGFPVFVNPTCSGHGSDRVCSFVFVWIATHTLTDVTTVSSDAGRAVVSRSHPALIYWRALTEPRDKWDCDTFGDQCKYDKAHADDCIDSVSFPALFSWGGVRYVTESLGSTDAQWRSSMSGAVVFSEALFGGRPNSAVTDLIDGFTVSCDAGITYEANSSRVGSNTVVDEDDAGEAVEESRALETLGNLFDTLGTWALPLTPLVLLYVVVDEITSQFPAGEAQKQALQSMDDLVSPLVSFSEKLFDVFFS